MAPPRNERELPGNRRDAFGDQAAGAALRHRQRGLAQAEVVEHDLLQRIALRRVEPVVERLFHAAGQFVDARLRRFLGRLGAEQRELDVAGVGQDGGFHIGVLGVDGRQQLVGLRLGNHGGLQRALGDEPRRKDLAQARQAFGFKQRLALGRRAGDEHDQLAIALVERVDPLPRRAAVGIGKHGGALDHVGLLQVVRGHGDAPRGGARMQRGHLRDCRAAG